MAKKIKQVHLAEEEIHKNNGKEITHTISKIKAHEKLYTFFLVIVFMITIGISIFLGLKVDSYQIYDPEYYQNAISLSGQLLTISSNHIMSDSLGLQSNGYTVRYKNNTGKNINFLLRLAIDEDQLEKCNCEENLVDIRKIKFSLNGETIQQFSDEAMIITAGMLKAHDSGEMNIRIWFDESVESNSIFYGKFTLEQLEDMD